MSKCLVSGSFDPITKGHIAVIEWAKQNFDEVIVGVFVNEQKSYLFDISERVRLCEIAVQNMPSVKVVASNGFVADFCKENQISAIVRGFRNHRDYGYETEMAVYNYAHCKATTYLIPSKAELLNVSSSLVRKWIEEGCKIDCVRFCEKTEKDNINCLKEEYSDKIQNKTEGIEDCLPEQVLKEIRRIKYA